MQRIPASHSSGIIVGIFSELLLVIEAYSAREAIQRVRGEAIVITSPWYGKVDQVAARPNGR
jgi:hypothetical protein